MTRLALAAAAALVVLTGCVSPEQAAKVTQPPKYAIDQVSGSTCLAQRKVATDGLLRWLDEQIADGRDSVSVTEPLYALLAAEDRKVEEDLMLVLSLEVGIITTVSARTHTYLTDQGLSDAQAAAASVEDLAALGFDTLLWRGRVMSTRCELVH